MHQKYDLKGSTYKRKVCNIAEIFRRVHANTYDYVVSKFLGIEIGTFKVFSDIQRLGLYRASSRGYLSRS